MIMHSKQKTVDQNTDFFDGCRVVVTGAEGTVGSYLVRELLRFPVIEIRAFLLGADILPNWVRQKIAIKNTEQAVSVA